MKAQVSNSIFAVLGLTFVATGCASAGPQSVLDPYQGIQAPAVSTHALSRKSPRRQENSKQNELVQSGEKNKNWQTKDKEAHMLAKTSQTKPTIKNGQNMSGPKEIIDGIAKTTKSAGSSIMHASSNAGHTVACGGEKIGDGLAGGVKSAVHGLKATGHAIASGAQTAGSKLALAPKALGHGLKFTGEKLKDGSSLIGQKVAVAAGAAGHSLQFTGGKLKDGVGAIGRGLAATADRVKDGSGAIGKQIAAVPTAVSSKVMKAFGRNRDNTQTASVPVSTP